MLSAAIQRHPSIRLLLPLVAGIILGWYIPISHIEWICAIALLTWVVLVIERLLSKRQNWLFGSALNVFLICCGYILTSWQLAKTEYNFTGKANSYIAVVKEPPQEKPRTYLLPSDVYEQSGESHRFLLYIAKDDALTAINRGDTILVNTVLQAPSNDNTGDFDYVSYLKRKGVTGTAYVRAGHWQVRGHSKDTSWTQQLQDFRTIVINKYKSLGFEGDELAILSALTTGMKEELSDEIREVYSIAGVSHVLALSGLHIGLIYGFLLLLLMPIWKHVAHLKPIFICIIIITLWVFAIFTGLSTSVVRSTIMFSLHAIALMREERPATLHVLTLTAFGMLLYNPLWLFDVGFQLSFIAVAAIIILQPRLSAMLPEPCYGVIKKIKDIMTVSIAAQIGTAPLVILYFHRFSTHFLLSNIVVLPLITAIMYGAVIMLIITPLSGFQQWLADCINSIIRILNELLHILSRLPMASIDHLWTNALEIALFYCCVYLFIRYLNLRTAPRAISTLCVAWFLVGCHLVNTIIRF